MPRPKGSKNKRSPEPASDLGQITAAKEALTKELAELTDAVDQAAQTLKEKKAELKAAQTRLSKLEKQEAAMAEQAALEQRKAEADKLADAFLKSGKTLDEVMELLQ